MRAIGMAERAQEDMIKRSFKRKAFGKLLAQHETVQHQIAENRWALNLKPSRP